MSSGDDTFNELLHRARAGDAAAGNELIRQYERDVRLIARVRLSTPAMRRTLDSMDVCQSVLANFMVRLTAGQFELDTPAQLLKLLATMVRNKVTDSARRQRAARRDIRRTSATSVEECHIAGSQETPSGVVATAELLEAFDQRLSTAERELIEGRRQGQTWEELAARCQGRPEALRKQLSRAVDRVSKELGLSDVTE